MRPKIAALAAMGVLAVLTGVPGAPAAWADDSTAPPYVDHADWGRYWGDLSTLRVYPTPSGRAAARALHTTAEGDEAWAEVLADVPDADQPGMRAQFLCHWQLAEFARPGKISWNIEPWRPVVDDLTLFSSGCNPGGAEEPN